MKRVVIIGGGIGGLAAACLLAKDGYGVTVLEKNRQLGGRAGTFSAEGFTFDTGPSWYLMPDVFEHFFDLLGERIADHLELVKLSPNFRVFYQSTGKHIDVTGELQTDMATFDAIEPGAGAKLEKYLARAEQTYHAATRHVLYRNFDRTSELFDPSLLRALPHLPVSSSLQRHVAGSFRNPQLQQILTYSSVFLGADPATTPAVYGLLNHSLFNQGVFYPQGGMYRLIEALVRIGTKHGVRYQTNSPVEKILTTDGRVTGLQTGGAVVPADVVISDAGVQYTETQLLGESERDHSPQYWRSRRYAPSALLLYLGLDRQYSSLAHHNLLFSKNWQQNFADLQTGNFPADPSIYVGVPSKTDPTVAPKGKENLFVLVPVAAGLAYSQTQLKQFTGKVLATLEQSMHLPRLRQSIIYQKLFCVEDFAQRFNSPLGSGLGLAHTLKQSAVLRPRNMSRKVKNLYYVGADVHPGIGLPPVLISAELVCRRLNVFPAATNTQ